MHVQGVSAIPGMGIRSVHIACAICLAASITTGTTPRNTTVGEGKEPVSEAQEDSTVQDLKAQLAEKEKLLVETQQA